MECKCFNQDLCLECAINSCPSFLLARLYCTRLKSFDRDEDAHEELRKIRVSRRTTDRRTEDDIKEAFWGVVDRIFHMERTGEDKRIAELAMGFVRDAQRPLSIDELLWLLSTDDDMPYPSTHRLHKWNYVRSCCHGLIEDDDFRTVVFIHRTMLDCLEDPQYASKIRVQHGEFAKRCLYQLTHAELNKSVCLDSKALDDRLVKFPLFDYAARYWHYHVARSSKTRTVPGTRVSIPGSLLHVLRQFLDDDLRVEAAFQVTLFPTRDFQSYLDRAIEEIPLTEASIRSMKAEEKVLFDPFQRNKMTGLHVACQYGFEEIASKYITKRKRYAQSLDGINIHKCTPLHYAVEGQHFQIAKALLDAGANMNCYDIFGGTPLIDSLYHSDTSMAKLLLRGKRTTLDVNAQTAPVTEFKPHEFKLLYRKGPPDLRESVIVRHRVSGRTALHYAARNNMEEITQLLLATRKVDCSLQDTQGQLAWHKAAKYGHVNILSMLLGHGMDPSSRAGQTPEGKEPDPEIKNYEGYLNTALHIAAKSNSPEVVNYLLDKFPYLAPLQNGHGETALSLAVGMQEADMVGLLLEKPLPDGIEVGINIENEAKRRPIHVSVFDKSGTCMRLLLGCEDIEVDIKDSDGNSPLDLAAKHGYPCHIEQLLELDIYFERGCEQWRRALRCAYKEDNMRTYRALFSSKKIHGMLDAEYAELRDMVLSVPPTVPLSKDILDAMTKM
jgi:ankyrin repeat protein